MLHSAPFYSYILWCVCVNILYVCMHKVLIYVIGGQTAKIRLVVDNIALRELN